MEDVDMKAGLDFAPLYRSSVGFDRVLSLLETAGRTQSPENYPPYDILKTGDNAYRISMAVAGFAQEDLNILAQPNLLVVTGEIPGNDHGDFLHRGIANRAFTRRFELADHVRVTGASLAMGLLNIELERDIPEAMKPRRIEIATPTVSQRPATADKKAA